MQYAEILFALNFAEISIFIFIYTMLVLVNYTFICVCLDYIFGPFVSKRAVDYLKLVKTNIFNKLRKIVLILLYVL